MNNLGIPTTVGLFTFNDFYSPMVIPSHEIIDYMLGYIRNHKDTKFIIGLNEADLLLGKRTENAQFEDKKQLAFILELLEILLKEKNVILIGTTNEKLENFEPAAIRTGRFGSVIHMPYPNHKRRQYLINLALNKKNKLNEKDFDDAFIPEISKLLKNKDAAYILLFIESNKEYLLENITKDLDTTTKITKIKKLMDYDKEPTETDESELEIEE